MRAITETMNQDRTARWVKRGLWLIALWMLGVAAVGIVTLLLKWGMGAAGIGS